jgi:HAE1 family hydrophobic/amphiphilic exporter-1
MNLPNLSVNRPVTMMMVFLGVILLGFIAWSKLPQELFPSITYPQITVVTSYENAAPEEIETLITKIVEEAVGTVNNVKRLSSTSKEGSSLVMVEFNWGTNMDFAALNVREKIDLIKERLPRESEEPIVMKYNPFDLPIMNLSITGEMPPLELRELCRKYIKDEIEKVEGVASAAITGGAEREILVEIDQPRLRASQLSLITVVDALKAANLNYPAGTIKESFYEYLIRTMGEFEKVEEIKEMPAGIDRPEEERLPRTEKEKEKMEKKAGRLILLKDIAQVKDTTKEKASISRYNGKESISISIRKQSGTNTLMVVNGVRKAIKKLFSELPKGIRIEVTYDQSTFIKEAIANVRDAAIQGGILAFLVLLFFLREFRSSGVITVSMPISIMATFALMYFGKINLNMMSLGGLALGVGMLVDNSVVVIENIFRHRQLGKGLKESTIVGTGEMVGPIMGSTLTTVAVFLPFAFVVGIVGQIFKELSLTITFSLLASIVVALSLIPVLMSIGRATLSSSRLRPGQKKDRTSDERETGRWDRWYSNLISTLLKRKYIILIVVLLSFLLSMAIITRQDREFMPKLDQRQFIIKVDLPPGSRLEVTDSVVKRIEGILPGLPETKDVTTNIGSSEEKTAGTTLETLGSHQTQIMVNLKKLSAKKGIRRSTEEVIQELKSKLEKENLEDAQIEYIAQETSFRTALEEGTPIVIEIRGPDLNQLTSFASSLQTKLNKIPGIYGVKNTLVSPSPETKLHILKDRASLYGLSVRDIAVTAQVALKGYIATKFKEKDGTEVDVRVRLRPQDRSDFANLRRLLIHSPLGMEVPLSEVAYLSKGVGPTEIRRFDQQRAVLVTANIFKRGLTEVIEDVQKIIKSVTSTQLARSKDYSIELTGERQKMAESFKSLRFALILAFLLVYMIMAAEFESLWQPFLIMFTVPLSLIGVAFSLFITHTPLSVVVFLGIIMLGGIVVNNGIVLIDFIDTLRSKGFEVLEAAIVASRTRLRPILMTSLTTILGLLPLALGLGEGAELRAPLALTVIGGLTSATFLTLVVIPALYLSVTGLVKPKPKLAPEIGIPKPEIIKPEVPEAKLAEPPPQPITLPHLVGVGKVPEIKLPVSESTPQPPLLPELKYSELNKRQREILDKLKEIQRITRKEYIDLFNISTPTAARDLKELVERGLLRANGPLGPGRWYELV